ncbi:hypothetical protein QBC35DRAFT_421305, partial [Podospora australis]
MLSVNLSQGTSLAGWVAAFCLLVSATAGSLWFRFPHARFKHEPSDKPISDSARSASRGVRLHQVHPEKNEAETDVDIIAIHGLDTDSDTWTWKDPKDRKNKDRWVDWLRPGMLPETVDRVRIFTCDWPAALFQPSDMVQKTIEEYALLLLNGIQRELLVPNDARGESRPILFIASCLGGIVLIRALIAANDKSSSYYDLRSAIRGIVFLATPFRGTSFEDVAAWAEPGLKAQASIRGREVSHLLENVKGSTFDLEKLVRKFTDMCRDRDHPCLVFTFYEKGKTSLPLKIFPWLPIWLRQEKQLVNESSATLDIVLEPLPLDRPHVLTNKFDSSACADYKRVAGKIQEFVTKIREGTLSVQADGWIREICYSKDRLKIERLSGDLLPMERCYINLAIVEEPRRKAGYAEEGSEQDAAPRTSHFSLAARLKVETPEKNMQVELSSLFDPRKDSNGQMIQPRRILIRGSAGVGKTTLCKKMVHDFIHCGTWKGLFDRVLWVPLRRLKGWSAALYNLEELFSHEYFAQHKPRTLAKELRRAVESGRTLFILDGLDEIFQLLDDNNQKSDFLQHLLNQSSVIITTRPHVSLPVRVRPPDLELETIGFYPNQVKDYLGATFTNPNSDKVEEVQTYLEAHELIQGLVRIPIQLDALCYTWESFGDRPKPQTMTAMYKAIEESLWEKDIVRMEKRTPGQIRYARRPEIIKLIKDEAHILECLAFMGMYNDIIDFQPEHRDAICVQLKYAETDLFLDGILGRLSFLRTSDSSLKNHDRNYHFLHLTFQEYFAARYFVRQWKVKEPLNSLQLSGGNCNNIEPATFLQ